MALELQRLRHVIALAEHGSFVRAAAALHISQPALSRSIQNLERRFGSELFRRSRRGVAPTDLGLVYIERARDVLRLADELDREVASRGTLGTGRVAVGGGPYPVESIVAPAAVRFAEQFPTIRVQLTAGHWDELVTNLRGREIDFFVAETSTLQREPDLDVAPMPTMHSVYLFGRAGHPLAERGSAGMADALAWPFVTPSRVPPRILNPMLAAHRTATQRHAVIRPFPAIQCNALAPVKRIIATSNALSGSILSCIATELESGRFVLLGTEPWLHLQYGIVSLKTRPWTQAAAKLREFVLDAEREVLQDEKRLLARFAPGRIGRRAGARTANRS